MKTILLCIDTAGPRCAVAVHDMAAGALLARADPDIGRGHAERLMGLIAEMLAEAGASYGEVARIGVCVGPGSFTGLRVGIAAAKGLALALDVGCTGVSTLDILAEPHWAGGSPVLSVIDAKRGEVYAALFGAGGETIRGAAALAPAQLTPFVVGAGFPLAVVGTGSQIALDILGADRVRPVDASGDVAALARIAAARTPSGPVKPLYLRGADAKPQGPTGVSHMHRQATLP